MKTINKLILFAGLTGGLFSAAAGVAADDFATNVPAADTPSVAQPQTPQPPDSRTTDPPAPTPDAAPTTNTAHFPQHPASRMPIRALPLPNEVDHHGTHPPFL